MNPAVSNSPPKTKCPDDRLLSRYTSGRIDELRAEAIDAHLDQCEHCQRRSDELAGRADSLLQAMRRDVAPPSDEDSAQIDKLIADVRALETQALGSAKTTNERKPPSAARMGVAPLGLDEFVACLHESGLIEGQQLDALIVDIDPSDSRTLACELVAREQLTPFQAKALLQARWRGLFFGDYVILEKLGEGGMARVFKAQHRTTGRTVCLKILHASERNSAEHLERFRREVRAVSSLSHPNVVVAHDADEADGLPCLVMEFVEGNDLAKHVKQHGPMAVDAALRIVRQVALALQYVHEQGVVHRDVKPHNLLLNRDGNVTVLDLGLARFDSYLSPHSDATTHASMTSSGVMMGTVDYMSPEQAMNSRQADRRSDIYSLGCTLHFLLTGKVVFDGETIMEKLVAHRERTMPTMGVAPEVQAIFAMMTAKAPEDRYQSMAMVAADIDLFAAGNEPVAMAAQSEETIAEVQYGSSSQLLPAPPARPTHATEVEWVEVESERAPPTPNRVRRWALQALFWTSILAAAIGVAFVTQYLIPDKFTPDQRVLAVVPLDGFDSAHYQSLRETVQRRNMQLVPVSWKSGMAQPGNEVAAPVSVQSIYEIAPEDFGTIIFLGGSVHEFQHAGDGEDSARRLIESALDRRQVVAAVGGDFAVVMQHLAAAGIQLEHEERDGLEILTTKDDRPGRVVHAQGPESLGRLIDYARDVVGRNP